MVTSGIVKLKYITHIEFARLINMEHVKNIIVSKMHDRKRTTQIQNLTTQQQALTT
jgi:hypothetical protein